MSALLVSCGDGGSGSSGQVQPPGPPAAPTVTVSADVKQLIFSWDAVATATHYELLENPDGHSGFTQVGGNIPVGSTTAAKHIAVHLHDWLDALYIMQACNSAGCTASSAVSATNLAGDTIGYFRARDTRYPFADNLAVCGDGTKMVVAAFDGAYIYRFNSPTWTVEDQIVQQLNSAWVSSIALSEDGNTLALGASGNDSGATGIDGDPLDDSAQGSGAVYVYRFDGNGWSQQAFVKASNTGAGDGFGAAVALSADGNMLVVGADGESSGATGLNGDQNDDSVSDSGAAYIFRYDGVSWVQQVYVKPSNTPMSRYFGRALALDQDGSTLAVGSPEEESCGTGVNGDQYATCTHRNAGEEGAVYLYQFDGVDWYQQAYIKGRSIGRDHFGRSLSLSNDGDTLAVGETSQLALDTNGAYVFRFDGADWYKEVRFDPYIFSDPEYGDPFTLGRDIAINGDATLLVISDGRQVFLIRFDGSDWSFSEDGRLKNPWTYRQFGAVFALSNDSQTLTVMGPSGVSGVDTIFVY